VRLLYESGLITKIRLVPKLNGANLSKADLSGASRITGEELKRQVAALEGATMPGNQKYEDWFKSKGCREGGKNSGPS
jgi:hypothetical protein